MNRKLYHIAMSVALASSSLTAAVFVVNPTPAFDPPGTVLLRDDNLDGVGDAVTGNPEGFPAFGSFNGDFNAAAGMSFVLPALPVGESITSVTFTAFLDGNQGVTFNADVYGIRTNASGAWQTSDYGIGPGQAGPLLQDNWTLSPGSYLTPIDVTSFVGANYAVGNSVFFRVAADADTATVDAETKRAYFQGANQTDRPQLTITTAVPEPSTYGVIAGLLAISMALIRRRNPLRV